MMSKRQGLLGQKTARRLIFTLSVGGLGSLLFFFAYWVSLLLINHHPAFIPNAESRIAMFRFLIRQRPQAGQWVPRQGGLWIF